jgi:hypothetical protein
MSFRNTRATPEDFAIGTTVAAAILGVLFAFVSFSEQIILIFY